MSNVKVPIVARTSFHDKILVAVKHRIEIFTARHNSTDCLCIRDGSRAPQGHYSCP